MTAIGADISMAETRDLDAELMQAAAAGDHAAFTRIVDRHKHALVNYLTHLSGDRDHAEELAQEAFLRLYQSAGRYDDRGKLGAYLFSIATNLVRTEQRRSVRWRRLLPAFLHAETAASRETPQTDLLATEAGHEVRQALARLPLHFRAPLVLREIEEWSYQEIAAALGCRVGTVKSRINRGRERLRVLLEDYWKHGGER